MVDVRILVRRIVGIALEDALDPEPALVRPIVVQEIADLSDRRNAADQIEMDAAEELGIVGRGGRLDPLVPGGSDTTVDLRRQRRDVFVGRTQGRRGRRGPATEGFSCE